MVLDGKALLSQSLFQKVVYISIPDVTFINLQYKDFADDLAKVKDELGVTIHNFEDLDHLGVTLKEYGKSETPTKIANLRQSNTILNNPIYHIKPNTWEWDDV